MSSDEKTVDELRDLRNRSLKVGFIHSAKQYNEKIEERTGESENADEVKCRLIGNSLLWVSRPTAVADGGEREV